MNTGQLEQQMPRAIPLPAAVARPQGLDVTVKLWQVVSVVAVIICVLIVSGTAANIVSNQVAPSPDHKLAKLMNRFDIAFEPSIPNWYSSCSLLVCSALLSLIARAKSRDGDRWRWHWLVLAILFLGLSIDECVRLHEMLHNVMASRVETHGLLYFPWVIPALIFVAVVGLAYLPFLLKLDRSTALLFVTSGAIYVMGAVGMDMIGGAIVESYGMESIQHSFAQAVEELLEMLGVLLFLYALLTYIGRRIGPIRLSVTNVAT